MRMISWYSAAKHVSGWVFCICYFSFALWWGTGFAAIYPSIAALAAVMAAFFWILAHVIQGRERLRLQQRSSKNDPA
jgi:hypothetical protein